MVTKKKNSDRRWKFAFLETQWCLNMNFYDKGFLNNISLLTQVQPTVKNCEPDNKFAQKKRTA